ncbi:hypothetical protein CPB84DRAFT_1751271 [Gymnopilus junonius]|uniref:Uncharacterized protein n=1 Tax=Gymnopilus junonius TaxID=109634 RepID=A0A9P5NBY0_GYMJU|nr:hypothetical protein CPB84DRAFT_1751271 [Gymnopilus junonius]
MVHFQILFFAVSGLLFKSIFAVPVPVVEKGQIVHVAADQTNGNHYEGQGAAIPHPNIVLDKKNGQVVLAPVTHAPDEKNGPFITHAEQFHPKLEGNVLLHHVTADEANIPQDPSFHGEPVYRGAIDDINKAKLKAAVDVHTDAANSHVRAAQAHSEAAEAHEKLAKMWKNPGDPNAEALAKEHLAQADAHRTEAILHYSKATTHRNDAALAENGKPLTYDNYSTTQTVNDKARQSKNEAEMSEKHAKAAAENLKASKANLKASFSAQGAQKKELETKAFGHLQKAREHAPSSAVKPDPDQSLKAAQTSRNAAKKLTPSKKH